MIRLSADSDVPIPGQRFALQIFLLNPRIALLFLRTPVALGGKKSPKTFKYYNNKYVGFQMPIWAFDHGEFKV